jgi:hypothetical protein
VCEKHDVPEGMCISDGCGNKAIGGMVRCWECNSMAFGFAKLVDVEAGAATFDSSVN